METLIFLDFDRSKGEVSASSSLLGTAALFEPDDLIDFIKTAVSSPVDLIASKVREANALMDERPLRAWQLALQAVHALGDSGLPNGITDTSIRESAEQAVFLIGLRLLTEGVPSELDAVDVLNRTGSLGNLAERSEVTVFIQRLEHWIKDRSVNAAQLLSAACDVPTSHSDAVRVALSSMSQSLSENLDQVSRDPLWAAKFTDQVEHWLRMAGHDRDSGQLADRFRCVAFETLFAAGRFDLAGTVNSYISMEELDRSARLHVAQKQYADAALIYERNDNQSAAATNWRRSGHWVSAAKCLTPNVPVDLSWLAELDKLAMAMPEGLLKGLDPIELEALRALAEKISVPAPKGKKLTRSGS